MVINKDTYHLWLSDQTILERSDLETLQEMVSIFPYCQTNHLLYTKCLQNIDSFHYNQSLKKTAAYAADRHRLFDLLTNKEKSIEKDKKTTSKLTTLYPSTPKANGHSEKEVKEHLKIGQPIEFNPKEKHSFIEWLKLSQAKPITRTNSNKSLNQKVTLIEDFIAKRKRTVSKTDFFSATNQAKKSESFNFDIVTETLAKVYLEQEHYEKAKEAYKLLILKYPQKSSLFASQIELIETLIKNK